MFYNNTMNDTTFKIDAATKEKIYGILQAEAMSKFVQSVKDAGDTGTFEVIITTADIDRAGEIISLDGWDFSNYLKSPVVLWGHNYQEPPIGICLSLEKVNGAIVAKGKFAPTPFAQQIRALYDLGMCRATSVGFIPTEQEGNTITRAELLEFSFVSVPANPYALSLRRSFDMPQEAAALMVKGIQSLLKEKKDAEAPAADPVPPAEEKKPDEATPPADAEKKGAVADELTAEQAMEAKYDNLEDVFEVVYAFCDVYCDEATPVADFGKLLTETIGILSTIADGSYVDPDDSTDTSKSAILTSIKSLSKESVRTLSKHVVALQSILAKSEDGSKGNGEATPPADAPVPPADADQKKAVLEIRSALQDVSTILGDSLGAIRKIAKENKLF